MQGAWGEIIVSLSGDGHQSSFIRMFELPVAALYSCQDPALFFQLFDDFSDFHGFFLRSFL